MREGENGERMSWRRRLTLDRPVSTRKVARLEGVHIADWKIEDCGWRENVKRAEEELRKDCRSRSEILSRLAGNDLRLSTFALSNL
jgi:hypothetical protein